MAKNIFTLQGVIALAGAAQITKNLFKIDEKVKQNVISLAKFTATVSAVGLALKAISAPIIDTSKKIINLATATGDY